MAERGYEAYGPEEEAGRGESRGYALAEKIAQLIGMAHEELSEEEWADFCEAFQSEAERVQRLEEGAEEETGEDVDESEFSGEDEAYERGYEDGEEDTEFMNEEGGEEASDDSAMPQRGGRPMPPDDGDFYGAEYGVEPAQGNYAPRGEMSRGAEMQGGAGGMSPEQRAQLIEMLRQRMKG